MRTSPRPLARALAVVGLTAVFAVGCGVEAKDEAIVETPVEESTTSTPEDVTTTSEDGPTTSTTEDDGPTTTTTEDDEPTTTTTEDDGPIGPGGGSVPEGIRDQLIQTYVDMGFTEDQASCLTDHIFASGGDDMADMDSTAVLEWLEDCNISMSDLGKLDG